MTTSDYIYIILMMVKLLCVCIEINKGKIYSIFNPFYVAFFYLQIILFVSSYYKDYLYLFYILLRMLNCLVAKDILFFTAMYSQHICESLLHHNVHICHAYTKSHPFFLNFCITHA